MGENVDLGVQITGTLTALMRHRGLTDRILAARCGYTSRGQITARRLGTTHITASDIGILAAGLAVDPCVLLMPKNDALRWVLDHDDEPAVTGGYLAA